MNEMSESTGGHAVPAESHASEASPLAPSPTPAAHAVASSLPSATSAASPAWVMEDGAFAEGWLDHLPEQLADARPTLGKYRNLTDLAKAHYSLQQLMGRKAQAVVVPNEKSAPEEIAAYREAMGIPERAEDYALRPEKIPQGLEWNEEISKNFSQIAHQHNVPPAAMRALVAEYTKLEEFRSQSHEHSKQQKVAEDQRMLHREWGGNYDKNLSAARRMAATSGVKHDSYGFNDPNVVRALANLSNLMSEDHLVTGESTHRSFGARAKDIQTNPQNAYYARYHDADPEVVQMVRNLLRGK